MKQTQTSRQVQWVLASAGMAVLALSMAGCHSDQPAATAPVSAAATPAATQTSPAPAQSRPMPPEVKQRLQSMSPADRAKYESMYNQGH